jgi:hypothetical protein
MHASIDVRGDVGDAPLRGDEPARPRPRSSRSVAARREASQPSRCAAGTSTCCERDLRQGRGDAAIAQLVVFDLYGTLLDISGLAGMMSSLIGSDATVMLSTWRTASSSGPGSSMSSRPTSRSIAVTAWALAKVAGHLDEPLRARLSELWLTVPAHADAAAALRRLRAAGVRTAVLSNGTRPMIERALERPTWRWTRCAAWRKSAPTSPIRAFTA